ncbi:hypothetical protein BX661DRAFT_196611 [Kickxella alabastrina]|uniref:uncharacterized protein n=1 Tax=Kickxella alabastrina TaxID=61397 RepID=UPI002220A013|nr:uncharacterized protein BX661DRAFT_196611 [Kickxella alabastrina]KAI7833409.1 hypothetical protein BX661DRAFT_196611 [Kickxella alabastrina]
MVASINGAKWRTLYRELARAAPGVVSAKRQPTVAILGKIRQGFNENKSATHAADDLKSLYERGYNTLGFLKLARELDSVERRLATAVLDLHKQRRITEEKPPAYKRRLQPLQKRVYDETYAEYDRVVANIERDLNIILPRDKVSQSLEWIPLLKSLHRGDTGIDQTVEINTKTSNGLESGSATSNNY